MQFPKCNNFFQACLFLKYEVRHTDSICRYLRMRHFQTNNSTGSLDYRQPTQFIISTQPNLYFQMWLITFSIGLIERNLMKRFVHQYEI